MKTHLRDVVVYILWFVDLVGELLMILRKLFKSIPDHLDNGNKPKGHPTN